MKAQQPTRTVIALPPGTIRRITRVATQSGTSVCRTADMLLEYSLDRAEQGRLQIATPPPAEPFDEENPKHSTSPLSLSQWQQDGDDGGIDSTRYEVSEQALRKSIAGKGGPR